MWWLRCILALYPMLSLMRGIPVEKFQTMMWYNDLERNGEIDKEDKGVLSRYVNVEVMNFIWQIERAIDSKRGVNDLLNFLITHVEKARSRCVHIRDHSYDVLMEYQGTGCIELDFKRELKDQATVEQLIHVNFAVAIHSPFTNSGHVANISFPIFETIYTTGTLCRKAGVTLVGIAVADPSHNKETLCGKLSSFVTGIISTSSQVLIKTHGVFSGTDRFQIIYNFRSRPSLLNTRNFSTFEGTTEVFSPYFAAPVFKSFVVSTQYSERNIYLVYINGISYKGIDAHLYALRITLEHKDDGLTVKAFDGPGTLSPLLDCKNNAGTCSIKSSTTLITLVISSKKSINVKDILTVDTIEQEDVSENCNPSSLSLYPIFHGNKFYLKAISNPLVNVICSWSLKTFSGSVNISRKFTDFSGPSTDDCAYGGLLFYEYSLFDESYNNVYASCNSESNLSQVDNFYYISDYRGIRVEIVFYAGYTSGIIELVSTHSTCSGLSNLCLFEDFSNLLEYRSSNSGVAKARRFFKNLPSSCIVLQDVKPITNNPPSQSNGHSSYALGLKQIAADYEVSVTVFPYNIPIFTHHADDPCKDDKLPDWMQLSLTSISGSYSITLAEFPEIPSASTFKNVTHFNFISSLHCWGIFIPTRIILHDFQDNHLNGISLAPEKENTLLSTIGNTYDVPIAVYFPNRDFRFWSNAYTIKFLNYEDLFLELHYDKQCPQDCVIDVILISVKTSEFAVEYDILIKEIRESSIVVPIMLGRTISYESRHQNSRISFTLVVSRDILKDQPCLSHCQLKLTLINLLKTFKPLLPSEHCSNVSTDFHFRIKNMCFYIKTKQHSYLSWNEAENQCNTFPSTGLPVIFDHEMMMEFLNNMRKIIQGFVKPIFIGLSQKSGLWEWQSGEPLIYHNLWALNSTQEPPVEYSFNLRDSEYLSNPAKLRNFEKLQAPYASRVTDCAVMDNIMIAQPYLFRPISCEERMSAILVCSGPADLRDHDSSPSKIQIGTVYCPEDSFLFHGNCIRLLNTPHPSAEEGCSFYGMENITSNLVNSDLDSLFWIFWPISCLFTNGVITTFLEKPSQLHYSRPEFVNLIGHYLSFYTHIEGEQLNIKPELCKGGVHMFCVTDEVTKNDYCAQDGLFRCSDDKCIGMDYVCDGYDDCLLGEDEHNCDFILAADWLSSSEGVCDAKFTLPCGSGCILLQALCDKISDCSDSADESGCSSVVCSEKLERSCDDGMCVFHTQWCNFEEDCLGGEDEVNCQGSSCRGFLCKSGKCIKLSQVDDLHFDCEDFDDEIRYKYYLEDSFSYMNQPNITNLCAPGWLPCVPFHPRCFPMSRYCEYDRISNKQMAICGNGAHLQFCDRLTDFRPDMYRCPESYYISFEKLCDGIQDCPDGSDEQRCELKTCPLGHYKCHNSTVCVHPRFLCDGLSHCPEADDEANRFCVKSFCPTGCKCWKETWVCSGVEIKQSNLYKVKVLHIDNSRVSWDHLLTAFPRLRALVGSHLSLISSDGSFHHAVPILNLPKENVSSIVYLNLSHNNIFSVNKRSFAGFQSLRYVFLHNNKLEKLPKGLFSSTPEHLELVDLSYNEIGHLSADIFMNTFLLGTLNLMGNRITSISSDFMTSQVVIQQIVTTQELVSCLSKDFSEKPLYEHQCISFFENSLNNFVAFSISGVIFLCQLTLLLIKSLGKGKNKSMKSLVFMELSGIPVDLSMGLYLSNIGVAGYRMTGLLLYKVNAWKSSPHCSVLNGIALFSLLICPWHNLLNQVRLRSSLHLGKTALNSGVFNCVVILLWSGALTAIILLPKKANRFCFPFFHTDAVFGRSDGDEPTISLYVTFISTALALIASSVVDVSTVKLFFTSKKESKRENFTRFETNFMKKQVAAFIVNFVHLVCIGICSTGNLSLHVQERLILYGLTASALLSSLLKTVNQIKNLMAKKTSRKVAKQTIQIA